MLKLPRPSLIVFDLDNTLYDYEQPNTFATQTLIEKISSQASLESSAVKSALEASRLNVKRRLGETASSHSRLLYIAEAYRLLNLRPVAEQFLKLEAFFWDAYLSQMQLFPGVNEFIQLLKKQDIPLALVTDLTSNIQYKKLIKLELGSCFDFILTSEEAGGDKSSGIPFEMLSTTIKVDLNNAWFIGDSKNDHPVNKKNRGHFFRKVKSSSNRHGIMNNEFHDYSELSSIVEHP